ncbi:MAG TPA: hypothetical protein VF787_03390 [Thermoanaerobaculia bacterium]
MIVTTSKLQRTITLTGIEKVKQISVDASGYLKRLNVSPREAESVLNRVHALKAELDKVPSHEQGEVAIEVNTDVSRVWLTTLVEYTRTVTLLERKVAQQPELGGIRSANTAEEAANKLAAQMQDQLNLPIQNLDSIIAEQEKREKEEDKEFAKGTSAGPHRGVGKKAKPDEGLAEGAPAADPRNRRGSAGAAGKGGKRWNREHKKAGDKRQTTLEDQPPAGADAGTQDKRDGPANKEDVEPIKAD